MNINEEMKLDKAALLQITASAECYSEHPLAKAVIAHAKLENNQLIEAEDFQVIPGKGISASINGKRIFCGNAGFLLEQQIKIDSIAEKTLEQFRNEGKAVILVAGPGKLLGALTLLDTLRGTAADMISRLHETGVDTVLLTGDHKQTAEYFSRQIGIEDVHAGLLPEQKVSEIAALQGAGKRVCMIGDVVNDAPALKTADVSVAMGRWAVI